MLLPHGCRLCVLIGSADFFLLILALRTLSVSSVSLSTKKNWHLSLSRICVRAFVRVRNHKKTLFSIWRDRVWAMQRKKSRWYHWVFFVQYWLKKTFQKFTSFVFLVQQITPKMNLNRGFTKDNSELEFVTQTPLRTTVVVDTMAKCEAAIQQIISYVCCSRETKKKRLRYLFRLRYFNLIFFLLKPVTVPNTKRLELTASGLDKELSKNMERFWSYRYVLPADIVLYSAWINFVKCQSV